MTGRVRDTVVSGDDPGAAPIDGHRTDRDSCLHYLGAADGSAGRYDTDGYHLQLRGEDLADHHLTHLHEIHHKALNDDTCWGLALHLAARHPRWNTTLYPSLLAACRTVHEVFATFLSVQLARTRHPAVTQLLGDNPHYYDYLTRMERLLAGVPAGHRKDLAATGIARFCMSGPILDVLASEEAPTLAMVRTLDRPDARFHRFQRLDPAVLAAAGRYADASLRDIDIDVDDLGLDHTDAVLDDAWSRWEQEFVTHAVRADPHLAGRPILGSGAHLIAGQRALQSINTKGNVIDMALAPPDAAALSDLQSTERLLSFTRIPLAQPASHTRQLTVGGQISVDELVRLVDVTAGPDPALVVHGRRNPADTEPRFSVRVISAPDDASSTMLHALIHEPHAYRDLMTAWTGPGTAVNCVTVSCFLDAEWQSRWMPVLLERPTVLLLDTALSALAGAGRPLGHREPVWGRHLDIGHPQLRGLVWHVEGQRHVMLAIGDDLAVQLIGGALRELLGDRLHLDDSDWTPWGSALAAVVGSLVATEPTISFDNPRTP
ncbi:hypothetical protein [Mycolicibacterium sp. S3B2]|uniref:hypothetical protein n=1 Tax=Mycolicibacterium sp. S3B2 TaxID=3415120 RepID=UPI003C79B0B1